MQLLMQSLHFTQNKFACRRVDRLDKARIQTFYRQTS